MATATALLLSLPPLASVRPRRNGRRMRGNSIEPSDVDKYSAVGVLPSGTSPQGHLVTVVGNQSPRLRWPFEDKRSLEPPC